MLVIFLYPGCSESYWGRWGKWGGGGWEWCLTLGGARGGGLERQAQKGGEDRVTLKMHPPTLIPEQTC